MKHLMFSRLKLWLIKLVSSMSDNKLHSCSIAFYFRELGASIEDGFGTNPSRYCRATTPNSLNVDTLSALAIHAVASPTELRLIIVDNPRARIASPNPELTPIANSG